MKKMTSNEIRDMYLNYFKEHGHSIMPSASLLIKDDPTLLWNNAGVTPLKKYFDGSEIPFNKRMTSSQKCIRTNDIESVGDDTHLTFFEMLGNFSIGDYFKNEAIEMSFELLTSEKYFNFPKDKLYMTIYTDDDEAFNKWVSVGVDPSHIIRLDDNFWEIGEGPCGPDSEIFYDRGEDFDPDKLGIKLLTDGIDNTRYVEIWNNVFSQFNSKEGVERCDYKELPNKNIDTGMGLERMTCVINEATSPYDTDLFSKVINKLEELSNTKYTNQREFRIIADHIRTLCFSISDGAVFHNEGRGYVIRRLLRRAVRFGHNIGIKDNFMDKLVDSVVETMEYYYPELRKNINDIKDKISKEEILFMKTLASGEKKLDEMLDKENKILSGKDAFKLYDTYGFPFELTKEYLDEIGYTTNYDEFKKCMDDAKNLARNARCDVSSMNVQNKALLEFNQESTFTGYNDYETHTKVIGLIKGDELVDELTGEGYVILKETPFYAEKGGQVSDTGYIYNDNVELEVIDMFIAPNKEHVHVIKTNDVIKLGDDVIARINIKKRQSIEKNHSACHLVNKALKDVLNYEVTQAGSKVDEYGFRFDFTYPNKISDEEIVLVENLVNEMINSNTDTHTEIMNINDAKKTDAVHVFDEKYDEDVRVVSISSSKEFCGGTHVRNTKDINRFAVCEVISKGANVYRLIGVTDNLIENKLFEVIKPYNDEMKKLLSKVKDLLEEANKLDININFDVDINNDVPVSYKDIIFNRNELSMVKDKVKDFEKEFNILKQNKLLKDNNLSNEFEIENDINYIIKKVYDYDINILKSLIDDAFNTKEKVFIFIANIKGNNVNFICKSNTLHAGNILKKAATMSNGNGGGSANFSQGGGTDISNIDTILSNIKDEL